MYKSINHRDIANIFISLKVNFCDLFFMFVVHHAASEVRSLQVIYYFIDNLVISI